MMPMQKGERLPSLTLTAAGGEAAKNLREGRGPRIVVTLHGDDCPDCAAYARGLVDVADQVLDWHGEVVIVLTASTGGDVSRLTGPGLTVLRDPEGRFADGRAVVTVTDEWAEVYFSGELDPPHRDPGPDELVEWARFVAIQCPECGVAEGPWRTSGSNFEAADL